jgi:hypothetical protein
MDSFTVQYLGWDLTLQITQSRFGLEGSSITGVQSMFSVSFTHRFNSNSQPFRRCYMCCLKIWSLGWDAGRCMRRQITWSRNLIPGLFGTLMAFMRMLWYVMTCMNISKTDTLVPAIHTQFPLGQHPRATRTRPPPSSHQRYLQRSPGSMGWALS